MAHILIPDTGQLIAVKRVPFSGDFIKAISPDGMRVGGYGIRYTTVQKPDLTKQYFRRDTDYGEEIGYKVEGLPIRIEHGMDKTAGLIPVGILDFKREDDAGKWIEGRLKDRAEYEDMLRQLRQSKGLPLTDEEIVQRALNCELAVKSFFASGKVQWSSGAEEPSVVIKDDGFIARWYPKEFSGTVQPAEPDGTEISPLKSLAMALTFEEDAGHGTGPEEAQAVIVVNTADKSLPVTPEETPATETPKSKGNLMGMSREQIMQVIAPAIEALVNGLVEAQGGAADPAAAESTQAALADRAADIMNQEDPNLADAKSVLAKLDTLQDRVAEMGVELLAKSMAERADKWKNAGKSVGAKAREAEGKSKAGGGYSGGNSDTPRITDMQNLKYAHLTGAEMALGLQMMLAPSQALGLNTQPSQVASEDYLKHMVAKAHDTAYRDNQGFNAEQKLAYKSVVPYKANELDASTLSGQGAEWVSQFWSTSIWFVARFEPTLYDTMVSKGMMTEEVPQGSDSTWFPTEGSDPVVYSAPQATSIDSTGRPEVTALISPIGTGRVQASPKELKLATSYTVVLEEDSVIKMAKQVNYQINKKMPETRDQVIINGDTETGASANINLIDGTPATGLATPYYINSNGLRKLPLVTATTYKRDAGTTLDITDYLATLKLLPAVLRKSRKETFFIIDPDTETASLAIPAIATDDVRRTNATITDGVLERIYGRDVAVSGFLPLANSAGKVPAAGGTLGSILCVYAPYWAVAWKRQITIETARDVLSGSTIYVASMRMCIVPRGTTGAAISYNVAV